jgi:hypothetical protein
MTHDKTTRSNPADNKVIRTRGMVCGQIRKQGQHVSDETTTITEPLPQHRRRRRSGLCGDADDRSVYEVGHVADVGGNHDT